MSTVIGITSGYFNPLHIGHLDYLNAAYEQCDLLCVIVNNDKQVALKGSCPFMKETDRVKIVGSLKVTDMVALSIDEDESVCMSILGLVDTLKTKETSFIFFNSGDRPPDKFNLKENAMCSLLKVEQKFLELPKVAGSRDLIKDASSWHVRSQLGRVDLKALEQTAYMGEKYGFGAQ